MTGKVNIPRTIEEFWEDKSTGALFLKIDSGKLLQVYFVNGEIRSIRYREASGISVLEKISSMTALTYQFHEGAVSRIEDELPSTADIIAASKSAGHISAAAGEGRKAKDISENEKDIIKAVLTTYIGPIAEMVMDEALESSTSIDSIIKSVTQQIDNSNSQITFQKSVLLALKNES
jgi:hypothetical protein